MDVLIIVVFLFAMIGMAFGLPKNRIWAGLIFGMLLGPIGWLLILLGPTVKEQPLRRRK